jgi:hypothetical protein
MNMNAKRYLLKSLNVLNLSMTATAIGFFITFLNPLLGTPISVKVPAPNDILPGMQARMDETTKLPIADYTLIGEKNLFHPDRVIPEEKKTSAPITLSRPELILHGTMMTSELKIAYLEDKKAAPKTPGRSAQYIVVKEGDNVSGYILKQITESMVFLANGEEQMTLYLDERKDRKGEITGPTKAPVPAQSPAATATPQAAPRPAAPPPAQRPSTAQPPPSAPPSPPRGLASQPILPTGPSGVSGPPNVQYAPPRPSMPAPSSPVRRGPP